MPKIRNIKILLKNRKRLRGAFDQILYSEKIAAIQNNFKINCFPVISFTELFSVYPHADFRSPINIRSDFAYGTSPLIDYFFLCKILQAINASDYFEIGTWVGLSAMNLSINSPAGTNIYTLDLNEDHPTLAAYGIPKEVIGKHSKNITNIKHLKGDSKIFDFSEFYGKMDMIFVDGSHSLDYVANDTEKAFKMLKGSASVIVWHDYIIGGEINPEVLCGILYGLPQSEHKHVYHLDQSNIAIYSGSYLFNPEPKGKWDMSEKLFDITINTEESSGKGVLKG